jgi:hypothetical protein
MTTLRADPTTLQAGQTVKLEDGASALILSDPAPSGLYGVGVQRWTCSALHEQKGKPARLIELQMPKVLPVR